jgi:hypothetical protein
MSALLFPATCRRSQWLVQEPIWLMEGEISWKNQIGMLCRTARRTSIHFCAAGTYLQSHTI